MSTVAIEHRLKETIATPTDLLKALSTKHPYYHSSDHEETYRSLPEFLDAWKNYDIDLNRVIRWDIKEVKEDFSKPEEMEERDHEHFGPWGTQYALLHFVAPRKGHTFTNRILNLKPGDVPRLYTFLKKHWDHMQLLWDPLPNIEYIPPSTPRSRFVSKVRAITDMYTIVPSGDPEHIRNKSNERVVGAVRDVLGLIDDSYILLEQPEHDDVPLDPGLNIAGELAKTYFDEINS